MSTQDDYPDVGDLVIATVKRIANYGAYVTLDEYNNKEGLIHTSEISTTWVRNIRDHVREGQRVVLKVLRVSPERSQIDLSLRRVTGREKKDKLLQWKLDKKSDSILKTASERLNLGNEQLEEIKGKILKRFDSVYKALEESVFEGSSIFKKLGIVPEHAEVLTEVASLKMKLDKARVRGVVEMTSTQSDGIDAIKTGLLKTKKMKKARRVEIKVYTMGAPRYRIEVTADEYSQAEEFLKRSIEEVLTSLKELKGEGRRVA